MKQAIAPSFGFVYNISLETVVSLAFFKNFSSGIFIILLETIVSQVCFNKFSHAFSLFDWKLVSLACFSKFSLCNLHACSFVIAHRSKTKSIQYNFQFFSLFFQTIGCTMCVSFFFFFLLNIVPQRSLSNRSYCSILSVHATMFSMDEI